MPNCAKPCYHHLSKPINSIAPNLLLLESLEKEEFKKKQKYEEEKEELVKKSRENLTELKIKEQERAKKYQKEIKKLQEAKEKKKLKKKTKKNKYPPRFCIKRGIYSGTEETKEETTDDGYTEVDVNTE
ncbi:unnamed protein product [Moneuplotes crassus]|uniref:Uncharacterized protein n=1 Tax=Euplotes crassus TaxID=5936 RepID=A0AAD1XFJ3_EUPCR|nr:unnamed protein product [Moneuplotes crassus]